MNQMQVEYHSEPLARNHWHKEKRIQENLGIMIFKKIVNVDREHSPVTENLISEGNYPARS